MKKIIARMICLVVIICLLSGCGEKKVVEEIGVGTKLATCTISYFKEDLFAEEAANILQQLVMEKSKQELTIEIKKEIDDVNRIYLGSLLLAEKTGVIISEIGELGYCIINEGDSYYIYANSEKGFNRAFNCMQEFISDEGTYLYMNEKRILDRGDQSVTSIQIGDNSIENYSIVIPKEPDVLIREAAEKMQNYIIKGSGIVLPIMETDTNIKQSIQIYIVNYVSEENEGAYKNIITDGKIQILGKDGEACIAGVYDFINTYLGWSFAGESREKLTTRVTNLKIPETVFFSEDEPWMEEREAIICLWNTNTSRGMYVNQNTSMLCDLMSYSDGQLYEYVKMLKHCGFTGVQITEMCSAWAGSGDYEYIHERIRILADAAHSMGMNVTIWVWGAEFSGYGWTDPSVSYLFDEYTYLQKNPRVFEFFDRYYSIYAELADCADRVIAHFYDPGHLYAAEDVAFYANYLKNKMQAINPEIDFGVNCWVDAFDKDLIVEELGNDITLYETGYWNSPEKRMAFRNKCDELGCRLGTWSWGTCEMEIDQLAQMNVNANIIQETYTRAMALDDSTTKPSYWSEMDSYHVLNVFSLYCAGHLLADPTADTETLLRQISYDTVGDKYQNDFYEILDLIQDARAGDEKESSYWDSEYYILRNEKYKPEEILARCNTYIPILDQMIEEEIEANTLPIPIDLKDMLKLIRPHLEQIKKFAEFKIGLDVLEEKYLNGENASVLSEEMNELYKPIPEYNCIIGAWGQIEARTQYLMIEEFCAKANIEVPVNVTFNRFRKMRLYQQLCDLQRGNQEAVLVSKDFYQWGIAYGVEPTIVLAEELVEEGLFIENEEGLIYLEDWENYIFDFK